MHAIAGAAAALLLGAPVWAPHGDRIAYMHGDGFDTVRADGSDHRAVVRADSGVGVDSFSWSPDGSRLAMTWVPPSADPDKVTFVVGVVDARSGRRRQLQVFTENGTDPVPAWSPRGDRIAVTDEVSGVWLIAPDGPFRWHQPDRIRIEEGAWSPDGSRFAYSWLEVFPNPYTYDPYGDVKIEVVDGDGAPVSTIEAEEGAYWMYDLAWSPDGGSLAYATMPTSVWDSDYPDTWGPPVVHVAPLAGSPRVAFSEPGKAPAWSQGGSIAYESSFRDPAGAGDPTDLQLALPDGRLTRTLREARDARWSPDGGHLAFVRRGAIFVADGSGAHVRWVTRGRELSWAPDGRRFAFKRPGCGKKAGLFVATLGGSVRRIAAAGC